MSTLIPLGIPVAGEGTPTVPTPRFFAQAPTRVDFTAADTDVTVSHQLGRAPLGVLVVGLYPNAGTGHMALYSKGVDMNEQNATLRASAAGVAYVLFL